MKLMINHQTHYVYTEQAKNSIQYIKMTPQNNAHQQVLSWGVSVPGLVQQQLDAFQNIWLTSSQRFSYHSMTIMAQGTIDIQQDSAKAIDIDLRPSIFLQITPSTICDDQMIHFARNYVPFVSHQNLVRLSEALLQHMPYISYSTQVTTTATEAFHHQQGVCQDHSHVFIGMCRALGIPARYASGYLYVPESIHLASHAWAEAFIEGEWHTFDVSNQKYTPSSHIYIAIGRDYWDVAPIRGVREKGGIESMSTIVQVLPC